MAIVMRRSSSVWTMKRLASWAARASSSILRHPPWAVMTVRSRTWTMFVRASVPATTTHAASSTATRAFFVEGGAEASTAAERHALESLRNFLVPQGRWVDLWRVLVVVIDTGLLALNFLARFGWLLFLLGSCLLVVVGVTAEAVRW